MATYGQKGSTISFISNVEESWDLNLDCNTEKERVLVTRGMFCGSAEDKVSAAVDGVAEPSESRLSVPVTLSLMVWSPSSRE